MGPVWVRYGFGMDSVWVRYWGWVGLVRFWFCLGHLVWPVELVSFVLAALLSSIVVDGFGLSSQLVQLWRALVGLGGMGLGNLGCLF